MDAMLEYQMDDPKHPQLHGAVLCPACHVIHGRCADAVYPLLALAQVLDEGVCEFERTSIPSDRPEALKRYPDIGVIRAAAGA